MYWCSYILSSFSESSEMKPSVEVKEEDVPKEEVDRLLKVILALFFPPPSGSQMLNFVCNLKKCSICLLIF